MPRATEEEVQKFIDDFVIHSHGSDFTGIFVSFDSETPTLVNAGGNESEKEDCWDLYKLPDGQQLFQIAGVRHQVSETWTAPDAKMYLLRRVNGKMLVVAIKDNLLFGARPNDSIETSEVKRKFEQLWNTAYQSCGW